MSKKAAKSKAEKPGKKERSGKKTRAAHEKLPPEAEDFGHTLRRAVRQKGRNAADRYGMYL